MQGGKVTAEDAAVFVHRQAKYSTTYRKLEELIVGQLPQEYICQSKKQHQSKFTGNNDF